MIFFFIALFTVVAGQACSCPSGTCLSTSVRNCFDTTITVPASVSASAVQVRVRAQSTDGSVFDLRVLSSSSYTCDGSYSNQYRPFSATGVPCVDTGEHVIDARTFTVVLDNENSFFNAPINYLVEWKALYDCRVCDACAPGCNDGPYGSRRLCSRGDHFGGVICRGSEDASSCCVPTTVAVATTTAVAASNTTPAATTVAPATTAANTTPATTGALSTTIANITTGSGGSTINICPCEPISCQGQCKSYRVNECQSFFQLCSGNQAGSVHIAQINGSFSSSFYANSDCSGIPRVRSFAACDTCDTLFGVMPKCTNTPATSAPTTLATSASTPVCDGEITTCNECIAKSELGFACDWCSTSGSCHGEGDFFTTCSGTWKETCSATTPRPTSTPSGGLYDCLACDGTCASGCTNSALFGPTTCSRGSDVIIENGRCRSSEDPSGCCIPSTPRPPSTPTPTKRTDVQSCKLNGSCDAENFCEALSAHLTCIVSSDLCNQYNQAFLSVVSQCPDAKTRCSCTTMEDPCQKSFVQCDKVQENCDACRSCECSNRCCKEKCRDQQASFTCSQTNGLISSTCSCTDVATVINSTPTLAISSLVLLVVLYVPLR